MRVSKIYMFNTILVHVARTWERIRLEQEHEEMPQDNIESVDSIVAIADTILEDSVVKDFLRFQDGDVWANTDEGISDVYIENLAETIIKNDYLNY